jgi:hypothetical protein
VAVRAAAVVSVVASAELAAAAKAAAVTETSVDAGGKGAISSRT